uniref:DUF3752 domain-containing protein n=2 Tax=Caenorhabditis japonica TaxID=281687 RepID=A0A8R1DK20_CAEJA
MSYGPQLPSWLTKDEKTTEDKEENVYGPSIPNFAESGRSEEKEENEDNDEDENECSSSYGPSIPANFRPQVGPSLPVANDSDDEIGPMPMSKGNEEREAIERAYRIVMQKEAEDEEKNAQPKREEWMTSVPKSLGNFGLGARTFKKGTVSERDATWEDAPGAKKKRKEEPRSVQAAGVAASDARQAGIVAEKAAGPSLLELHQKKRNEKLANPGYTPGERRPFDREKDMEVRGLKPGASKDAVDRMKEFTDRFANGKDQRFL